MRLRTCPSFSILLVREELSLHVLVARRSFFGPADRLDFDLSGLNCQISHAD